MNEHEETVSQVLVAYKAAVNAKDVDTFVSICGANGHIKALNHGEE